MGKVKEQELREIMNRLPAMVLARLLICCLGKEGVLDILMRQRRDVLGDALWTVLGWKFEIE